MLIVTRKINDSIQIGENISVKVVNINGNVVELNVAMPDGDSKNAELKYDEQIEIRSDVSVKIINIVSRFVVRLGVTAPRNMKVIRIPR